MPLACWNASRVGRRLSSASSMSMYCGQFEKLIVFSLSETSSLTQLSALCCEQHSPGGGGAADQAAPAQRAAGTEGGEQRGCRRGRRGAEAATHVRLLKG
jgi:hypothetical protein